MPVKDSLFCYCNITLSSIKKQKYINNIKLYTQTAK